MKNANTAVPAKYSANNCTIAATSLTFNEKNNYNILKAPTHNQACHLVLQQAGAPIDGSFLPEMVGITENSGIIVQSYPFIARRCFNRIGPKAKLHHKMLPTAEILPILGSTIRVCWHF